MCEGESAGAGVVAEAAAEEEEEGEVIKRTAYVVYRAADAAGFGPVGVKGELGAVTGAGEDALLRGKGSNTWGRVARFCAAGSVGNTKLPRWPHAARRPSASNAVAVTSNFMGVTAFIAVAVVVAISGIGNINAIDLARTVQVGHVPKMVSFVMLRL